MADNQPETFPILPEWWTDHVQMWEYHIQEVAAKHADYLAAQPDVPPPVSLT